jgi:protein subunit release factor A
MKVVIEMSKELLFSVTKKDFEISYFSGTGAGGQNRNRHLNCVRLKHIATGIVTTGQAERSLEQNKKFAFKSLVKNHKFKNWLRIETAKAMLSKEEQKKQEEEINKRVEKLMKDSNIIVEELDIKNKKWKKVDKELE